MELLLKQIQHILITQVHLSRTATSSKTVVAASADNSAVIRASYKVSVAIQLQTNIRVSCKDTVE